MIETNICVLGAGPAGATTALFLAKKGIACILVDKAHFPREKVCGDALSGKVIDILNRINPELVGQLGQEEKGLGSWGITLVAPNGQGLKLPFPSSGASPPGFTSPRTHFDNILVEEVQRHPLVQFKQGLELNPLLNDSGGIVLGDKQGKPIIKAKLVIAANGAYSSFTRRWAKIPRELRHYGAGVTAYYQNVGGFEPDGFVELHFLEALLPGYFWVFPLPGGLANAGVYVRSDVVAGKKINLKQTLEECISQHRTLKERFLEAKRVGSIRGFGLPLGSKSRVLSGDNYLLSGDAGHLIDPFTGEGIGNAMLSGMLAAHQAIACVENDNYSAQFLRAYDLEIKKHLGQEFKISNWVQKMSTFPYLWNLVVRVANSDPKITQLLSRMLGDGELRDKLIDPKAYLRLAWKKWRLLFSNQIS